MKNKRLIFLIVLALEIKLFLFLFAITIAPQGKILPDSHDYLRLAASIVSKGAFGTQDVSGAFLYDTFRTPGYPIFLAIFHGIIGIPLNGIIALQAIMTVLAALIIYKAAKEISPGMALIGMAIMLFDPPITVFSFTVLTESLFLLLASVFVYSFILYLKYRKMYFVVMSAIFAGLAAYVRPIGYYVGMVTFLFMLYESVGGDFKKKLKYALVFIVITYSVIGLWQVRNYVRVGDPTFCSVGRYDLERQGIFHSYSRNADPYTKGMAPLPYYINVSFRSLMSVMTKPGTLKYFGSTTLTYVGKVVSYPWMALWLSGFIIGVLAMRKNIYIQFLFFVASYFIFASVGAQMWIMGEKLRVSIMPFIAVISAYGYLCLIRKIGKRKIRYKYETGESPAWR